MIKITLIENFAKQLYFLDRHVWAQSLEEAKVLIENYELKSDTSYSQSHKEKGFGTKGMNSYYVLLSKGSNYTV